MRHAGKYAQHERTLTCKHTVERRKGGEENRTREEGGYEEKLILIV